MPAKGTVLFKSDIKKAKILLFCAKYGRRPSTNREDEYKLSSDMRNYIKKSSTSYDSGFAQIIEKYPYVNYSFMSSADTKKEILDFCKKYGRRPSRSKDSNKEEKRLAAHVTAYKSKKSPCYDPVFAKKVNKYKKRSRNEK